MVLAKVDESESSSVVSNSLRPHGLQTPWNSPGQNPGVGSCSLLQGIFPTHRWNPGLVHCRHILYQVSCQGSPSQHQDLIQLVGSSRQVAKVLELQLQLNPSNEYSGLISFRIAWFDRLAVQGTKKLTFLIQKILTSLI